MGYGLVAGEVASRKMVGWEMALFKIQVNLSSFSLLKLLNSYVGHSGTYRYEPNSTVAQLRFRLFLIVEKAGESGKRFWGIIYINWKPFNVFLATVGR